MENHFICYLPFNESDYSVGALIISTMKSGVFIFLVLLFVGLLNSFKLQDNCYQGYFNWDYINIMVILIY